ncbi:putative Muscarinic acetylcholine receptor gar-3 [Hypsibius exemplaris]|uniref:Muscarinic acetylcholine receptor gar-3 n=1 Tax=Hypsibius exemplaris TaxID=2072580 RepID=A0A9X6NL77_HYPEX|nr:putative Muscarinic acetylcholine receptor gar-3 [Hypsibius exemplaris]
MEALTLNLTADKLNESSLLWSNSSGVPVRQRTPWWAMSIIAGLITTTISSNLLIIASFLSEPRLRRPFNLYLFNLAVSDLLVGCIGMPHFAVYTYYDYWPLSYVQCSFWMFCDYLSTTETLWGIVAISLDRAWAVTLPLSYRHQASNRKCLIVIFSSWIISAGIILPGYIRTRSDYTVNSEPYACDWNSDRLPGWASVFYVTVFGEWIPVAVTAVSYVVTTTRMYQKTRKQRSRIGLLVSPQAFILLTLLVMAVIGFWTPWLVFSVKNLFFHYENDLFSIVSYWMCYSMSGVNPFLFNAASDEMRRTMKRLLRHGRARMMHRRTTTVTGGRPTESSPSAPWQSSA